MPNIRFHTLVVLFGIASAFSSLTRAEDPAPPAPQSPMLSEKEISELKREQTDPENKRTYSIEVTFTQKVSNAEAEKKHRTSGTIPYCITASLTETREVRGKLVERLMTGDQCRVCVLDKDGKPVLDTVQQLAIMCPS